MIRLTLILTVLCAPAWAESKYPEAHINALACNENLDISTTWPQCLGLIFADCQTDQVGSADHITCLDATRESWTMTVDGLRGEVLETVTTEAALELGNLLGQWTGYVAQKCQSVADSKPENGQKAARFGCEITEIVGLSGELAACLEGRSTGRYCRVEN